MYLKNKIILCITAFIILIGNPLAQAADTYTKQAKITGIQKETTPKTEQTGEGDQNWVACGPHDGICKIAPDVSDDEIITVRYGLATEGQGFGYLYTVVSGIKNALCNDRFGDPLYGVDKKCHYTTSNVFDLTSTDSIWTQCASEGDYCQPETAGAQWMRYGLDGRWFYIVVSDQQFIRCTNAQIGNGYDPVVGQRKVCELGPPIPHTEDAFSTCATDGSMCTPHSHELLFARYGALHQDGGKWTTRMAQVNSFDCSPSSKSLFNRDPVAHYEKQCDILKLISPKITLAGDWEKVISCDGTHCPVTYDISVGTSRTNTDLTGSEYGLTITTGLEVEGGLPVAGGKITASLETALNWISRKETSQAITSEIMKTASATCDKSDASKLALYQFTLDSIETCINLGECEGTTLSASYICVYDAPADYPGPQCLPGHCANDLCTECDYPTE